MCPTVRVGGRQVPGRRRTARRRRYTVEELAEQSGLTSRTLRSYQTQGLLRPPEHRGRVAYYDEGHVERLALIAELKEQGLSLSDISDVVRRREAGERSARRSAARRRPPPRPRRAVPESEHTSPTRFETPAPPPAGAEAGRPPRRRWRVLTGVVLVAVLVALAAQSAFVHLRLNDAEADRTRLGRQLAALRSEIARLPKEQAPPVTVLVPAAGPPPAPQPAPPTAPASPPPPPSPPPAARTAVVPASPPPTQPPAPPPTPPCTTLPIINRCL